MSLRILFHIVLICSHLFCANAIQADDTIAITPAVNEDTKDETQGKQQPNYPPQMDGANEEVYKSGRLQAEALLVLPQRSLTYDLKADDRSFGAPCLKYLGTLIFTYQH